MKHEELIHKIIGCAMEVHQHLGNGFQEVVYQSALTIEMRMQGIEFNSEQEIQLEYKGYDVGTREVAFFVENLIMVEIKAVANLEDVHLAQTLNCIEVCKFEIGLLINFGSKSLQHKRVDKNSKIPKSGNQDDLTNHGTREKS